MIRHMISQCDVSSRAGQRAFVLLLHHDALRPTRQLIGGSIRRCRRSVGRETTRSDEYVKALPLGLRNTHSSDVYTTQQCHNSCLYLIIQTKQALGFYTTFLRFGLVVLIRAGRPPFLLGRSLFFSNNLTASWLLFAPTVPVVRSEAPRW